MAAAGIALFGNAGIIPSTTQILAGHLPMDVLMGMALAGVALCWRAFSYDGYTRTREPRLVMV